MNTLSPIFAIAATEIKENHELLAKFRVEVTQTVLSWTNKRLATTIAYLNNLIYCAAKAEGIVQRDGSRQLQIAEGGLFRLKKLLTISVPLTYTQTFLGRFWSGVLKSRGSLRIIREKLASVFGLFEVEPQEYKGVKYHDRVRAIYNNFDIQKALLVYEQLESILLERGCDIADIATHRGCFCKLLYNVIFTRCLGFGRKNKEAGYVPMTQAEAAVERAERSLKYATDKQIRYTALSETLKMFRQLRIESKYPDLFYRTLLEWRQLKEWFMNRPEWDFSEVPF